MFKVVRVEKSWHDYHDGDSQWTGWIVVRWDGTTETVEHFGTHVDPAVLPAVDADAAKAWQDVRRAAAEERQRIAEECRDTEIALNDAYHVRRGRTVRAIKGRKIPVGTVTVCRSNPTQSTFSRNTWNVVTDAGWIDTDNLECAPTAGEFPAEMRCPACEKMRAGSDYMFSGWEGFGRANRGVEWCRFCAAASYANTDHGTAAHTLALAVLAGDMTAVCPLIDELIADGNDFRADELKRLHKLDKPARKPRKKKADAVPV